MAYDDISLPGETWKPIVGFPKYVVSDMGRLRSLPITVMRKWNDGRLLPYTCAGRFIKGFKARTNVSVCLMRDGKTHHTLFHVLVLEAFVGPRPHGKVCCHNDGDFSNNRLDNLRWDTPQSNVRDSMRHGTWVPPKRVVGVECHNAKVTPEIVREIRSREYYRGIFRDLGVEFGIHKMTVHRIYPRYGWKHIEDARG
jgi:hypothetical protein